jgi:hypothetical protein
MTDWSEREKIFLLIIYIYQERRLGLMLAHTQTKLVVRLHASFTISSFSVSTLMVRERVPTFASIFIQLMDNISNHQTQELIKYLFVWEEKYWSFFCPQSI